MRRLVWCVAILCGGLACAGDEPAASTAAPWPLWDGKETIEQYAERVNLPPTKTLDLGNGVNLELVLIPAGKFVMGTPEPKPVDEEGYHKKIVLGQAAFAAAIGALLVLITTIIVRAIRQRRRPQYSLARFMAMTVVAGVGVMGGMHWWHSTKALEQAQAANAAAALRYGQADDNEKPAHDVTLSTPLHMGKYAVTQAQYMKVMGTNPSHFKGANLPVEQVSWNDAMEFCKKVGEKVGLLVRLPTDAERECACRAGTTTTYYTGDGDADLERAAWCGANSGGKTHPVGQKESNAFGLYDMHGNVWAWCQDWYEAYKPGAVVNPQGPPEGQFRVLRGGSWSSNPGLCRSAYRLRDYPVYRYSIVGFRVVVVVASRTP